MHECLCHIQQVFYEWPVTSDLISYISIPFDLSFQYSSLSYECNHALFAEECISSNGL